MNNTIFDGDKLYSVYDDISEDSFHVGYFVCSDDLFAVFNLFTTRGYEDGFYLTRLSNIYRIDFEDCYSHRILRLSQINNQKKSDVVFSRGISPMLSILDFSQKSEFLVTVELENGAFVTGEIDSFSEDLLTINVVSDDGVVNGKAVILIDTILRLRSNSGTERNLQALLKNS